MKRGHRIILIGLRAAGKTTVGKLLAPVLGVPFHDSDAALSVRGQLTVGEMIRLWGEAEFRRREEEAVQELSRLPVGILALGGGALESAPSRNLLGSWTPILLDAPDSVLASRIRRDRRQADPNRDRPPLTNGPLLQETRSLRRRRWPTFLSIHPWVVDTSERSPDEIAQALAESIRSRGVGVHEEEGDERRR